jgi:hypothetical protein
VCACASSRERGIGKSKAAGHSLSLMDSPLLMTTTKRRYMIAITATADVYLSESMFRSIDSGTITKSEITIGNCRLAYTEQ